MAPRIGFLGAGLIAHFHALQLSAVADEFAYAGVYDPDPERAHGFAQGWGAEARGSEDEVLADADAVYVCTWTAEHHRLVEAAAERGLAVFCEKPLAFDAPGAEAMADLVDEAAVVNQVGLVLRHSPAFLLLRALVADPAAGAVMSFVFRDDQYIPVQGMYASTWRGDRALAGSGTLLEHAIHDVDILERCLGPVASVSARSADFHGIDGIEDTVSSVLQLAGGGVGVHTTVWHDVIERPSLRRVEVFCERRHIVVENDWVGPVSWTTAGSADTTVVEGDDLLARCRELGIPLTAPDADFVRAVTAGTPTSPTLREAVRPHQVVDALYRSAAEGGAPVDL